MIKLKLLFGSSLVLLFSYHHVANGASPKNETKKPSIKIKVGNFYFPISDNRLVAGQYNRTVFPRLVRMYERTDEYFRSYGLTPAEVELLANIFRFAIEEFHDAGESERFFLEPLDRANASLLEYKAENPDDPDLPYADVVGFYSSELYSVLFQTHYWSLNWLMGMGRSAVCSEQVDAVLKDRGDWEKLGSNAANTLMALVPTILSFGHLYVPRSSEVFATSTVVGLTTSVYSLGLPVQSLPTIRRNRAIELATLGLAALAVIAAFAQIDGTTDANEKERVLDELRSWTDRDNYDEIKGKFGNIRRQVERWKDRWHWWHIPALLIAAGQATLFVFAIAPLFIEPGVSQFVFDCDGNENNWTGLYLGVSASANAVFRFLLWEVGDHERVKIYDWSPVALDQLRELIKKSSISLPSTAVEFPPLYRPGLSSFMRLAHCVVGVVSRLIGFIFRWKRIRTRGEVLHSQGLAHKRPLKLMANGVTTLVRSIRFYLLHPRTVLFSGFSTTTRPSAARRYRPLVVLVHLSTASRNMLKTLFTGFIEAMLLLALTFFFTAQWGGNLIITAYAMLLLLIFVTAGRAIGLIYVFISAHVWGLHVVNCDERDEIRGVLRILCSMTGVLVQVNGASYCDGYRLNDMPAFSEWRVHYEDGEYDGPD